MSNEEELIVGTAGWLVEQLKPVVKMNPKAVVYIRYDTTDAGGNVTHHRVTFNTTQPRMWFVQPENKYPSSSCHERTEEQYVNTVQLLLGPSSAHDKHREVYEEVKGEPVKVALKAFVEMLPSDFDEAAQRISRNHYFNQKFYGFRECSLVSPKLTGVWLTEDQLKERIWFKTIPEGFDELFEVHTLSPNVLTATISWEMFITTFCTNPIAGLQRKDK